MSVTKIPLIFHWAHLLIQCTSRQHHTNNQCQTFLSDTVWIMNDIPLAMWVVVAEWLRRWTWNPLGSPRAGSKPADNDGRLMLNQANSPQQLPENEVHQLSLATMSNCVSAQHMSDPLTTGTLGLPQIIKHQLLIAEMYIFARKRGCSSVVERMLCMYEAPGSIPGISKMWCLFCSDYIGHVSNCSPKNW